MIALHLQVPDECVMDRGLSGPAWDLIKVDAGAASLKSQSDSCWKFALQSEVISLSSSVAGSRHARG